MNSTRKSSSYISSDDDIHNDIINSYDDENNDCDDHNSDNTD